jgi:pimeloyl-ACP methyl ester carboxylesterase
MTKTDTDGITPRRKRPVVRVLLALLGLALIALLTLSVAGYRHPLATLEVVGRMALRGAGMERASVDGPRGPLVYWRGGTGSLVVFLHGANDQSGAWARVVGPVKARHRVLVPDLPGHGGSGPKHGPLGVADLYAGVEALLAAEARGEPATLVGNSMGGWLAMLYAHRHPDRVTGVVLVNGAALRGDGSEAQVNLLPKTREEARATMFAVTSPSSPLVPDFILDDLVRRAPGSPLARILASPVEEFLLDGKLGEIQAPVTLLWGADDKILPVSYAARVASQLPSARTLTIRGCGHIPQRECAPRLLPLLQQSLGDAGGAR